LRNKNLKLFAYSNNEIEDDFTKLIKKRFDSWILVTHKTDMELINLIRKDNIDILFDLSGHSKKNRLPIFKNRCAPVQATWIGWSASTGIQEIDYIIGDIYATPLSDQSKFSEKIYQIKNIWQCLSISNSDFKVPFVKNNNKENVVLGCLANSMKLNDPLIKTWSKILNQIPNSKLILRNKTFAIPKVRKKFIEKFDNNKVNKNQLIIEGQSFGSKSEYLEHYNKIDIILDTFPASGVTTSFDASYMGVPILTKIHNKSFWFRSGESINKNLNMDDWIAKDEPDYIQKAIKFAINKKYLTNLKIELRNLALKSSLFDSKNYSNDFYEMLLNIKK
jgi:predicted O-linked N-acetylglucosamine transferase (SPINDLY family)